jgi:hypothetical protein
MQMQCRDAGTCLLDAVRQGCHKTPEPIAQNIYLLLHWNFLIPIIEKIMA